MERATAARPAAAVVRGPGTAAATAARRTAPARSDDERRLRLFLLLWSALGYAALTLFISRYGHKAALVPVVAFSARGRASCCATSNAARDGFWPAAVVALFLALLVLRDFALYPNAPVHGMALSDFTVPTVFNPKRLWAAVLLPFAAVLVLGLGVRPDARRARSICARRIASCASSGGAASAFKLWLIAIALVLLGVRALRRAQPAAGDREAHDHARGQGRQGADAGAARAADRRGRRAARAVSVREAGRAALRADPGRRCSSSGVRGAGFMPALSAHFSPREVYETYNELAKPGETLVEYKVGARAAAYYARGASVEVESLVDAREQARHRQARAGRCSRPRSCANVDRVFRERTKRHLFVADARNARAMLATNLITPRPRRPELPVAVRPARRPEDSASARGQLRRPDHAARLRSQAAARRLRRRRRALRAHLVLQGAARRRATTACSCTSMPPICASTATTTRSTASIRSGCGTPAT